MLNKGKGRFISFANVYTITQKSPKERTNQQKGTKTNFDTNRYHTQSRMCKFVCF